MAMMQSYQCENTYQTMLKNFYSSCSRIDYELWFFSIAERSACKKSRTIELIKKMKLIDTLTHNKILLNEILTDFGFVSLITCFNNFVNSLPSVDDTNFYISDDLFNTIKYHISTMSEYLKKFVNQKKDILCSKELEEISQNDIMVPYELTIPKKKEKPATNTATKKKIKRNGCVSKSSATRKSNIEFSLDMQQNVDNLNILYSKFKKYGNEYLNE